MGISLSPAMASLPWMRPIAKVDGERDRIDRMLGGMEAKIRQAFLDAIDHLAGQIDVKRIESLLAQGLTGEAITAVNAQLLANGMAPIAAAVTNATITAGQAAAVAANLLPALREVQVSFGVVNPAVISHLHAYEMNKIRDLTATATASVKAAVVEGITAGRGPADIARDVKASIGLTEAQTKAVANFRRMLENRDKAVLTRALRDKRYDGSVRRAIENAKDLKPEQIETMVERYRARFLKFRATNIARTEAIRSLNAGNHLMWNQAVADGKVAADQITRDWLVTLDGREREAHRLVPSMNPNGVGLNEPFKTILGPLMYPGDPEGTADNVCECRCGVLYRVKWKARPSTEG